MATLTRDGYCVVEDNHLSAKRSGHVYGSLEVAEGIDILENGQFVCYDYAEGVVDFEFDKGPVMMVYNEEKLYDERLQMHKHYAMKREDFYNGKMAPRVIAIEAGDLWTTNAIAMDDPEEGIEIAAGDELGINEDGFLSADGSICAGCFRVVQFYTMPDGQPGVKVQCIKALQ